MSFQHEQVVYDGNWLRLTHHQEEITDPPMLVPDVYRLMNKPLDVATVSGMVLVLQTWLENNS